MSTLTTNGADLYYEVHGSGPPVVFCHGAGGNHLSWWQQVPAFSERYTCVTFDHRGFGRSLDPRPAEERPRFDEDLAVLVDHLELPQVRLVAQSMGGWTALGYAVTHPERVRALVMADTPGGLRSESVAEARRKARERLGEGGGLENGAVSESFRRRDPAGAFLYFPILATNPPRDQALGGAPMQRLAVSEEEAARLSLPVLFVEGEDDVILPPEVIRAAAALIPGARLEMVPEAGHSVYFERPDVFNRLVMDFFAGLDG